jgi:hypothetical protein
MARAQAALILALALASCAPRVAAAARGLTPAAAVPDSASAMNLRDAYAAAERLVGSRRHGESLPYFRRMIELLPADDWSLRHDYGNALQGASLESRTLHGLPLHTARSSYESIALMRAALAELDRAQRLAPTPRAAAAVHLTRARQLAAWGLPCDAWAEARAAASADPSWEQAALAERQWARRIAGDFSLTDGADSAAPAATRLPDRGGRK